jgi:hypothetical protein
MDAQTQALLCTHGKAGSSLSNLAGYWTKSRKNISADFFFT